MTTPPMSGDLGWRPIETAPRDGTPIRLRSPSYAPPQSLWWDKRAKRWTTWTYALARRLPAWWDESEESPTEWQPLATPTSNIKERITPMIDGHIRSDSCGPDDPRQIYIECPNCAAGRIYSLACDCCGWEEGQPMQDWSHRRRATLKEDNPDGN